MLSGWPRQCSRAVCPLLHSRLAAVCVCGGGSDGEGRMASARSCAKLQGVDGVCCCERVGSRQVAEMIPTGDIASHCARLNQLLE